MPRDHSRPEMLPPSIRYAAFTSGHSAVENLDLFVALFGLPRDAPNAGSLTRQRQPCAIGIPAMSKIASWNTSFTLIRSYRHVTLSQYQRPGPLWPGSLQLELRPCLESKLITDAPHEDRRHRRPHPPVQSAERNPYQTGHGPPFLRCTCGPSPAAARY